ncbi:MAG: DNA gyrase inhibitor YacG [Nitrosomonas sp.]|nr:DNA gyrase inhibitor YacG [Nitrosomonas sp.]
MQAPLKKAHIVNCPQCGEFVTWTASSRFRPFCSERCKMLDLGQWAAEDYRVSSDSKINMPLNYFQ